MEVVLATVAIEAGVAVAHVATVYVSARLIVANACNRLTFVDVRLAVFSRETRARAVAREAIYTVNTDIIATRVATVTQESRTFVDVFFTVSASKSRVSAVADISTGRLVSYALLVGARVRSTLAYEDIAIVARIVCVITEAREATGSVHARRVVGARVRRTVGDNVDGDITKITCKTAVSAVAFNTIHKVSARLVVTGIRRTIVNVVRAIFASVTTSANTRCMCIFSFHQTDHTGTAREDINGAGIIKRT